jgi:hypothetical protein
MTRLYRVTGRLLPMFDNQIAKEIAQGFLNAGATAHSVDEVPPLEIRDIAPYPALFRSEYRGCLESDSWKQTST